VFEDRLPRPIAGLDGMRPSSIQDSTLRSGALPVQFFVACDPNIPEDIGLKQFPRGLGVESVLPMGVPRSIVGRRGRGSRVGCVPRGVWGKRRLERAGGGA
jgi:hypothetical protein